MKIEKINPISPIPPELPPKNSKEIDLKKKVIKTPLEKEGVDAVTLSEEAQKLLREMEEEKD